MKKILFILSFTFIGHQVFSQMYIVTVKNHYGNSSHPSPCSTNNEDGVMTTIDPQGNITYDCLPAGGWLVDNGTNITLINQKFNSLISQGYKLVSTEETNNLGGIPAIGVWYFAIPWTSNGLDEISTTLKSFIISPNPAKSSVDITLDYSIKGKSEVFFINERGYIILKKNIQGILKNEKYNIDISKLSSGKYLVTIVNGKTYTTPKKMIVL